MKITKTSQHTGAHRRDPQRKVQNPSTFGQNEKIASGIRLECRFEAFSLAPDLVFWFLDLVSPPEPDEFRSAIHLYDPSKEIETQGHGEVILARWRAVFPVEGRPVRMVHRSSETLRMGH